MSIFSKDYIYSEDYIYGDFEQHYPPVPSLTGSIALLIGLFLSYSLLNSADSPSLMAKTTATVVGIALVSSIYFDSKRGLGNVFRTDVLCLIGLYFLTLAEFLFPQPEFNKFLTLSQTNQALLVVLVGLAGITIGRHLIKPKPVQSNWLKFEDISNETLFQTVIVAAFLGYLYMLLSVNFNVITMVDAMMGARFSQPWTRGHLGDWKTFITELSLLLLLIPPLTGVIWNRRQSFPVWQLLIVLMIFILTLFSGFSSGTRNIFIAYLLTFLAAYLLTLRRNNFRNTILPIIIILLIAVYGSHHMLKFRTIGLRNYIQNQVYVEDTVQETFAVDYNLFPIGLLVDAFPQKHSYLGFEALSWAIVKPIPRVLWPGKPQGLSVSIEEVAGAEGWTLSATYLGEAYMMGGFVGTIGMSLFLGSLAAWWNRMAMQRQSDYAMVIYALGFFVAGITMRSMFWLTTTMLPIVALIVVKKIGLIR